MSAAAILGGLSTAGALAKSTGSKISGGLGSTFSKLSLGLTNPLVSHEAISAGLWVGAFFVGLFVSILNYVYLNSLSGKIAILLLFPIVYKLMFQSYGENIKHAYVLTFYWSFASIAIPEAIYYITNWGLFRIEPVANLFSLLKIYIVAWPLWMMIMHRAEGKLVSALEVILALVVLTSLLMQVWDVISANDQLIETYISAQDKEVFIETGSNMVELITVTGPQQITYLWRNFVNDTNQVLNDTQQFVLTGKTYEERIDDRSPTESLGVTFESLDLSEFDGRYKEGSEISGWAILEANSLDTPIDVTTFCKINPKTEPFSADVNVESFTAFNYNLRDIVCTIPEGILEGAATHEMRIFADFDYTTSAYVRRYFIKQTDLSELQKNNIDPITQYNIPRDDEAARFTNGPLELQIIKNNILQGISETERTDFVIGIKLDNNRKFNTDGKIKQIDLLGLSLPPGFIIKTKTNGELSCSGGDIELMEDAICKERCIFNGELDNRCAIDCEEYTNYQITVPTQNDRENNFEDYVKTPSQISCTVETNSGIFTDSPISIKNFRAYADYTYQISIGKSFSTLQDPNYQGSDFKELPYCRNLYSSFTTSAIPTATQIKTAAKDAVEKNSYSGSCPEILKAMVAFNYRSGSPTGGGAGETGINLANVNLAFDSPISQSEATASGISITNDFISKILSQECTVTDKPSIDCALNYFYCGKNAQCAPTEIVISLANEYAKDES